MHLGPDKSPSLRLKIVETTTELAIQTANYISGYTEANFFHWTSVHNLLEVVNILFRPESGSSVIKGGKGCGMCACVPEKKKFSRQGEGL